MSEDLSPAARRTGLAALLLCLCGLIAWLTDHGPFPPVGWFMFAGLAFLVTGLAIGDWRTRIVLLLALAAAFASVWVSQPELCPQSGPCVIVLTHETAG